LDSERYKGGGCGLAPLILRGSSSCLVERESKKGGIAPSMMVTLVVCLITFTLLYVVLLRERMSIEEMKDEVARLKLEETV
jgi:hypothetical protein